jgi:hypothetical protein
MLYSTCAARYHGASCAVHAGAPYLQACSVRPPATQAPLTAPATAVAFVTACWASATCCIDMKHRLQIAQGVGPHLPSCSQVSTPVASSHTQRLVVTVFVHMRSVELQSGDVLQDPGARGVLGVTTRPPGRMWPVLVPCAVHMLKLPLGTYGTAGEVPGTLVRLARLHVGSKPAHQSHNRRTTRARDSATMQTVEVNGCSCTIPRKVMLRVLP